MTRSEAFCATAPCAGYNYAAIVIETLARSAAHGITRIVIRAQYILNAICISYEVVATYCYCGAHSHWPLVEREIVRRCRGTVSNSVSRSLHYAVTTLRATSYVVIELQTAFWDFRAADVRLDFRESTAAVRRTQRARTVGKSGTLIIIDLP